MHVRADIAGAAAHAGAADIWNEREPWQQPLAWSVALHAFLVGGILLYAAILGSWRGQSWGGGSGGGTIGVELVSNIPLPTRVAPTENIVANESKGLTKTEPEKKVEESEKAIPIPEKNAKRRPPAKPHLTETAKNAPPPPPQPANVVQYGQGGPVSAGMYGTFQAAGAKGGFGFTGGGGDFGSRFAWYVKVVRDKISENWLKYEVDPSIHDAQRVYVIFDIQRNGQPGNVQIEQSSGVPSLDQSALNAVRRVSTFGPLPNDYAGNKVSVEFWFDYHH